MTVMKLESSLSKISNEDLEQFARLVKFTATSLFYFPLRLMTLRWVMAQAVKAREHGNKKSRCDATWNISGLRPPPCLENQILIRLTLSNSSS